MSHQEETGNPDCRFLQFVILTSWPYLFFFFFPLILRQSDGVQQTKYLAQRYCQEAIKQISLLRPSAERDALIRLTEMVLTRDKWKKKKNLLQLLDITSGSYLWGKKKEKKRKLTLTCPSAPPLRVSTQVNGGGTQKFLGAPPDAGF